MADLLARWQWLIVTAGLLLAGCGGGGGGGESGGGTAIRATGDSYSVARGATLTVATPGVLANDTNNAGGTLRAVLVSGTGNGALTLNADGSFTYQHDGSTMNDSFVYRASNGSTSSNNTTVTLALGGGTPVAQNACHTFPANTSFTGQLPASGDSLVYEILELPSKGTVNTDVAGNFTYTPRTGVRGLDRFTFRARNNAGQVSDAATVSLLIDGALRLMPLGDSITVGTYTASSPAPGFNIGYRKKLFSDLTATANGRYGIDFVGVEKEGQSAGIGDPDHEGRGGFTAAEIAQAVTQRLDANPPDIVLLHIGTNDHGPGKTADPNGVGAILDNIQSWEQANGHPLWVFVARIIQRLDGIDVTPFNDGVAGIVAARNNGRLFVVNQQTGAGLDYRLETSGGDMADNLHPSQSGYDKMASRWRSDLLTANALPICP